MDKKMKLGFRGIFNRYTIKRNIFSCKSVVLAIISFGVCVWMFFAKDMDFIYLLLAKVSDAFVGSIPDLLGFCIGGYAIIVAINSLDKMSAIIKPQQDKNDMSYYHILSADFAMTLVIMCALLLLAYLTRFMVDLELVSLNDTLGNIANLLLIAILLWAGSLSVIMLMETVANLFNTSMILQAAATVASKTNENDENADTKISEYEVDSWLGKFKVTRFEKKK